MAVITVVVEISEGVAELRVPYSVGEFRELDLSLGIRGTNFQPR